MKEEIKTLKLVAMPNVNIPQIEPTLGDHMKKAFIVFTLLLLSSAVFSEEIKINSAKITEIYINGGQDSPNSGTTCFKVNATLSANCSLGYIGINNNNNHLLSALLTIKSTEREAWVYYSDSETNLHCPGLTFTPCALISISLK